MDVKVLLVKLIKTQTFLGGYIYYEKTIIASSLAVGLGVVAGNAGHADASEAQVNSRISSISSIKRSIIK